MINTVKLASKILGLPLVDTRDVLGSCYVHLLGRAPDAAGYEAYCDFLANGGSTDDLLKSFVESEEYQRRFAPPEQDITGKSQITLMQTCDGPNYYPLFQKSREANEAYALRNGFKYECFVGIKRGYFPWHACFNRIIMLQDMVGAGNRGWVFYLDADAYVFDQQFDLSDYLQSHADKSLIAAAGGSTGHRWDINDGVFLINLDHADAREIIGRWHEHFLGTSEDALRDAENWEDVPSDQPRLHEILQSNPQLMDAMWVESRELFNEYKSSFVRQALRGHGFSIDERLIIMLRDLKFCSEFADNLQVISKIKVLT